MLTYDLSARGDCTRYMFLYEQIRADITHGLLPAHTKLPAKRAFAQHLGVSVITVENAYVQLASEGYIYSKPRQGFYVAKISVPAPVQIAQLQPEPTAPTHTAKTWRLNLSSNALPLGIFPYQTWLTTMRSVIADLDHQGPPTSEPFGCLPLREAIAEQLQATRGMSVAAHNIVVAAGSQILYNLLIQFLGRSAVYAVEDPGYPRLADIYSAHEVHTAHIPMDEHGIRTDILDMTGARIAHVMPSHQFPTGRVTSVPRRYELLAWAASAPDRLIIEDDYDAEFRFSGPPLASLFSIDTTQSVIYMNTFSHTLGSLFRVGYMVLPDSLRDEFFEKMGFYSSTISTVEQLTLAKFMRSGAYERHVNRLRKHHREVRDALMAAFESSSLASSFRFVGADAGLHCVLELTDSERMPESFARNVSARLAQRQILLQPIDRYVRHKIAQTADGFVVQYSSLTVEDVRKFVREFVDLCEEELLTSISK